MSIYRPTKNSAEVFEFLSWLIIDQSILSQLIRTDKWMRGAAAAEQAFRALCSEYVLHSRFFTPNRWMCWETL
ncbi:hypothetical protein, partial [Salmonella sp. gx-f7]|uniref:hypothetical protein n=1 Tax=Salmonella sp. gx-f7 TaxID=2582606 RepID=UPI001F23532B